ncbi:MarR family transcriptional regulator (plasmid) [Rhizobium sp. TH2]|uniref:MarR family winged helix-turn-helix transcriptional regulator n=1 Tax=Rhizobium sp. TH2 TaxID=2775403 RepID=UPI002157BA1A|nr:MarR family transcriptional regulator [Rhizobium sp. TH2]UVC12284.1 MarR family transcriptional regulator [Rhizobium sp. TH2]
MDAAVRHLDQVKLGPLAGSVGFLLRLAQLRAFDDFFSDHGPQGLKPGEFSVLWVIARNPGIRQSVLGQRLMIKRAHMTKLIRAMEDASFVARRIPDSDRRAVELTLTPSGESEVDKASALFFEYEQRTGAPLDDREQAMLVALLKKYVGLDEEASG